MKLYIIVRNDLNPGLLTAQACHAAAKYCLDRPREAAEWSADCNLIVLSCQPQELEELAESLDAVRFFEPDLGGAMTAIACREGAQRRLSHLPLALRLPRAA